MKQTFAVLTLFLLVLTACGTAGPIAPAQQGVRQQTTPTATQDELTELLEEVKADTIAKNIKAEEINMPVNNKKAKVGDTVVFGLNFNQVNKPAATYFARMSFIEGRDMNSNKIEVDKDTIRYWLRESQTDDVALGEGESYYLPVVVIVKDEIKPGVKTVTGTYQFEVQFFKRGTGTFETQIDKLVKSVYVRVE